jgi:hypothetical protein
MSFVKVYVVSKYNSFFVTRNLVCHVLLFPEKEAKSGGYEIWILGKLVGQCSSFSRKRSKKRWFCNSAGYSLMVVWLFLGRSKYFLPLYRSISTLVS